MSSMPASSCRTVIPPLSSISMMPDGLDAGNAVALPLSGRERDRVSSHHRQRTDAAIVADYADPEKIGRRFSSP